MKRRAPRPKLTWNERPAHVREGREPYASCTGGEDSRAERAFSGKLARAANKPAARMIREVMVGIQARGSVRLGEFARALDEPVAMKKVIERLGRHLNRQEVRELAFGGMRVRFPGFSTPLSLLVVRGLGRKPLMLLSTLPYGSRKREWRIVESYLGRWRVEETIRFIKQSYRLEDIRLLTYERLRTIAALVMAAAYFTCVFLGREARLRVLATHAFTAAKRSSASPPSVSMPWPAASSTPSSAAPRPVRPPKPPPQPST